MKLGKILADYKFIIFTPILIYIGERSLIAYDEGYYALQAKWILDSGNWIAPKWWDIIVLDRTIGIQFLIALSQKIFGTSKIAIYIPTTFSGLIMLWSTYNLHKELIGKKFAICSPLILSTMFLWVNYLHLATQDIIYSSCISIGLLAIIKSKDSNKKIILLFAGLWVGLGFMLKTYLLFIPLIGLLPYIISIDLYKKRYFWIGLIVGFIPFTSWSYLIINEYGYEAYSGLFEKLISLSKTNTFTQPFYYYLWNLLVNSLPWSIFWLIGFTRIIKIKDYTIKYFLFIYPIIIISLLSLFSTKTPYYTIQILPLLAINGYVGIDYIIRDKKDKIIINLYSIIFPIIITIFNIYINYNPKIINLYSKDKILITIGLTCISISWILIRFSISLKQKIFLIIIGPYLLTTFMVQSGILSDRAKELRIETQNVIQANNLSETSIEVITDDIGGDISHSKIIKISLLTPKIGRGVRNIQDLKEGNYAWSTMEKDIINKTSNIELINSSNIFKPWKLIYKKD